MALTCVQQHGSMHRVKMIMLLRLLVGFLHTQWIKLAGTADVPVLGAATLVLPRLCCCSSPGLGTGAASLLPLVLMGWTSV